ncbi:MAG: lamin tail domain-containing protein [Ekhidna sp.]|uniref:lamin tail domain-containing protein n=1 Tax=Ekhidna sp. TaxID=2608089 RepID=UPI00329A5B62
MKGFIFLFLLGIGGALVGQVTDDFTDGDFTSNPTWSGDDSEFTIDGSNQLRLNNSSPASNNESYLSLPSIVISDATWEFTAGFVGLTSTGLSSSNQMFIFLVSDIADLEGSVNGYYVRVGGTDDDISLFSTNSGTPLIDGTDDVTQVSNTVISVRVTRDNSGNWELLIDNTGGSTYTSQGTATDITYTTSEYFGVMCDYTSTRATNFFFDDFNVTGTGPNDTTPPTIQSVVVISETEVDVQFDENVDVTTAENAVNYTIDGSVSVASASLDGGENSLVHLSTSALENGTTYTITINNVEDENGNVIDTDSQEMFDYLVLEEAIEFDVVINEFLASPSASSTIPNAEFVELFNRSSKFISLEDWTLSDQAGSSSTFSADTLEPGEFIILTKSGDGSLLETFGDVLEVGSFPSLNNTGDSIIISNGSTTVIHETAYTSSSSGISSELINPNGPDYSENNYGLSTDANGGTPGEQNSIFDDTPDTTPPAISSISVISSTELDVSFDELLEETSAETTANYSIDGGITVSTATRDASDNQLVHLTVSALPSGETRTLTVNGVEDLSGNGVVDGTIEFEYIETEAAVEGDVVINEFLASPSATSTIPNAEYVELYNRSTKFIDLSGWTVSDAAGSSSPFGSYILRPDSFLILTETDNGALFSSYGDILEINNFPSLNNAGDSIIISNASTTVIHETAYTSSSSGISSELINPNGPDYSENNYGLSTDADGGTPGEQNSIFDDTPDTTPPAISSISVISSTELDVSFDELLEETSAETTTNYSIDGGITVSTATRDASDNQLVHLTVSALPSGETRTLTVNGVEDLSGNGVVDGTIDFEYIETEAAEEGDVVINEFLADPIPSTGLPEAEFVELYNRSDKNISLLNWTLDGSTLMNYVLPPSQYVLVVDDSELEQFGGFDNVIGTSSLSLSNDEDRITLSDSSGQEIHAIFYEGSTSGVSMELINPNDPCLSEDSYVASVDSSGGTPGSQNAVFDDSPDVGAPQIQSYSFNTNLSITFSEVMDSLSLVNGTYNVDNGLSIGEIMPSGEFPKSVSISFSNELAAGVIYELTISGISDCAGNVVEETTILFGSGRSPAFNEVIITEIMFDPEPQKSLPVREFIEIYNATGAILTTENIFLSDASESVELPFTILNPGEFYVLTSTVAASEFEGNVIGISGFPSLNNSGEQLLLTNSGNLIFSLKYDPDWHDLDKVEGGYTLEMKDLNNPCLEDNNWGSSQNSNGGTPGMPNSISESFPDNFSPEIIEVIAFDSDSVRIIFNEKIHPISENIGVFEISSIEVADTYFDPFFPNRLTLALEELLIENTIYTLVVSGIQDCSGNSSPETAVEFTRPIRAEAEEIKLSEILFNPRSNGNDFVEIFNDSDNYISLKDWQLATLDEGEVSSPKLITDEELIINPRQYLAFTTNSDELLANYPKGESENFIEVISMPSYANSEGAVLLLNENAEVVESFNYNEDFHYGLLESADGVSLERVSFESPNTADNWRSASSTEGFATPGYANSQSLASKAPKGKVKANPEVFIPGNAGSGRDFTTINYELENPGQFANVNIYDQNGRLIKNLAQGVLLSTSGFLRWDGDTDDGQIARMGYYLIIFEIYDNSGNSEIVKENVVVGRDF